MLAFPFKRFHRRPSVTGFSCSALLPPSVKVDLFFGQLPLFAAYHGFRGTQRTAGPEARFGPAYPGGRADFGPLWSPSDRGPSLSAYRARTTDLGRLFQGRSTFAPGSNYSPVRNAVKCLLGLRLALESVHIQGNAVHAAGFLIHGLLQATIENTFKTWEDGDPGEGEADDVRMQTRRKVWRTRKLCENDWYRVCAVVRAFCARDISHLWQVLQHLDAHRGSLLRAANPVHSPFRKTFHALCHLVTARMEESPLAPIFHHFALRWSDPEFAQEKPMTISLIRKILVSQAAQVWWRFLNVYETYPYSLLKLVDATVDEAAKDEVAKGLFDLHPCCLQGDLFSARVSAMRIMNSCQ